MAVLVVGSVGIDTVQTPFGQVKDVLGGAACYFALAASSFTSVQLVGVVGSDFPEENVELLKRHHVDVEGLQRQPAGKTFRWTGRYDLDLNVAQTLETQLNVFAEFQPVLPGSYRATDFVYLANIQPSLQLAVLDQIEHPRFVGLDSMNYWIGNPETRQQLAQVIARVDAVFMNDAEIRQYTGAFNLFEAARRVLNEGPSVVLVKKGEHGAVAVSREGVFFAAPYPLEVVKDPTGAGDSFAGGFMGMLAATGDTSWAGIKRAMTAGCVVASFAVEEFSVQRLVSLEQQEIIERYDVLRACTAVDAFLATA